MHYSLCTESYGYAVLQKNLYAIVYKTTIKMLFYHDY